MHNIHNIPEFGFFLWRHRKDDFIIIIIIIILSLFSVENLESPIYMYICSSTNFNINR